MTYTLRNLVPVGLFVLLNVYIRPCVSRTIVSNNVSQAVENKLLKCKIYCHGPLLHTVQMAHLFQDSKTFVDMKLKYHPDEVLSNFTKFMESKNQEPTKDDIRNFVNENFDELGKEFEPWSPTDWVESPTYLDMISDPDLKQWAVDLNEIWKDLGRKMIDDVQKNPEYYSIIPVPHPVVVPGGRFIEFYYWDSYWIIRGLLYSEMYETVRGMLLNYLSIVQRYGFIPNGGRVYYSGRSQPPLLAGMIKSYVDFMNDDRFAIDTVEILEHEFKYWMNNHMVEVEGYHMATYNDASTGPRPESYREDIETSVVFATETEKEAYYTELKAAAESGMDFTSRWFVNENGTNVGNLTNLKTRSIIPVDLNALLYHNAKIIAEFYMKANNGTKMSEYEEKAEKLLQGIQAIHWNDEVGVWLDYDLLNKKPRNYYSPTNLSPLWMKAYDIRDTEKISAAVLNYIEKQGLDQYPGGVPNTLYSTGEQWDYPNVWPPMQYMLIQGLETLGTEESKNLSKRWGQRWVKSNFEAYRVTRAMFEKYDANNFGGHGGGGEYEIQKGFGWTNGIAIELLVKYGRELSLPSNTTSAAPFIKTISSFVGVATVALVATVFGHYVW